MIMKLLYHGGECTIKLQKYCIVIMCCIVLYCIAIRKVLYCNNDFCIVLNNLSTLFFSCVCGIQFTEGRTSETNSGQEENVSFCIYNIAIKSSN